MINRNRTVAIVLTGAALVMLAGGGYARAADAASPSPTAETVKPPAAAPSASLAAPSAGKSGRAAPPKTASSAPVIQVSGRVIHTWFERPGLKVILVIDGFTVMTRQEQLTARDGVIWFDEEEARKTGRVTIGVYAETGVEYRKTGGETEKFDSVYVVMETPGEISLVHDEPLRPDASNSELYLRAKKLRQEYVTRGVRETPTGIVPAPQPGPKVQAPGVREAGVPQEISIVAQDDVRQVNFSSVVEDGVRISTWTGGVYLIRGDMEMACDNLVIWTPEESVREAARGKPPAAEAPAAKTEGAAVRRVAAEAYLEGHVRIVQGRRILQCSQVYYDFQRDQALAINTKIKTFAKTREVPVYYYAKEVRQLGRDTFIGTDAWMTTCEFAEPHYDVGARKLTLKDLTPEPEPGKEGAPQYRRVRFLGEDVQTRIRGFPASYWPRLAGDFTEADTALRTIRIEHRNNRGTGLVTQWHLFKLLGMEQEPPGFDAYLDIDGWSKRGLALGVQSGYDRKDFYGEFLSYYLRDSGEDSAGGQDVEPPHQDRGRATWRHRQFLPQNWEMTLELSYISDRNFMHEFFREEDETGKRQETLLYLKKQQDDWALTLLASARVENFYTRTEYYPQIGYNMIGHSLWDDRLTYFQDSELSVARYRPDVDLDQRSSGSALLADTIHEVDLPLSAGPVRVVPFVEGRLSYFSESLEGGSKFRALAKEGLRAATQLWRTYDGVENEFLDLHRLRHVNIFDVRAYTAQCSVPSRDLFPFDVTEAGTPSVQGVDDTGVVELGWRQRFQTKRGPPGKQEIVDWITTDLEATFYDNRQFPNIAPDGGPVFNNLDFRAQWRATDAATLWTETKYNTDHGTLEKFTVGALITHTPRLTYTIGHRLIPDAHSAQTFFGFDYVINEKWRVGLLEMYDFERRENARTHLILTRRLHRWLMRIKLEKSAINGESFAGIEFQPIGISEVQIGW